MNMNKKTNFTSAIAGVMFGGGIALSAFTSASSAPIKAPPHTTKPIAPYTASDNQGLPATQLISRTTMLTRAKSIAADANGVVKSVTLTTYGKHLASSHIHVTDYSTSPNRQVYVIDILLPNGINSHGGAFGPNAEAQYAIDAQSGNYISTSIKGKRIGKSPHAR